MFKTRQLLKLLSISAILACFTVATNTYAASHAGGKTDDKAPKEKMKDEKKK